MYVYFCIPECDVPDEIKEMINTLCTYSPFVSKSVLPKYLSLDTIDGCVDINYYPDGLAEEGVSHDEIITLETLKEFITLWMLSENSLAIEMQRLQSLIINRLEKEKL